jgi:glycerol-3-phosphate dehydrogenase subunit B
MPEPIAIDTDFTVIGAGMAGLSAGLFARRRGLGTLVVGGPSELAYAAGPWDLLGVHPIEQRYLVTDPWMGIEALVKDLPQHPYARIREGDLRAAFAVVLEAFREAGYPYLRLPDGNCEVITSVGTRKRTYCLPHTMWNGVEALRDRVPCLMVDFQGLKDFSAQQIVATLAERWPDLQATTVVFPDSEHLPEVSPEYLARCLDLPEVRAKLANLLVPLVEDYEALGLPAILGHHHSTEVVADLEMRLGLPVFEVPSPPVSVPGLRIRLTFEKLLRQRGARLLLDDRVVRIAPQGDGFQLFLEKGDRAYVVNTRGVLLATGRFLGGGLSADRVRVRETLFDLPVSQPADRSQWHRKELLDPRGHPINQAGLEVDAQFRPLDQAGAVAFPTLFAAGSVLAHQDWMRMKCGAGLAITTSYAAVDAFVGLSRPGRGEA